MFAVIRLSGTQHLVKEKQVFRTQKLPYEKGHAFEVKDVLLFNDKEIKLGTPYIPGASVKLKVRSHGKGKKVLVFKMKRRKRYRRTKGHRQPFSEVEVTNILAA